MTSTQFNRVVAKLEDDEMDIMFNDATDKVSLWVNGKVVKVASHEATVLKHAEMLVVLRKVN